MVSVQDTLQHVICNFKIVISLFFESSLFDLFVSIVFARSIVTDVQLRLQRLVLPISSYKFVSSCKWLAFVKTLTKLVRLLFN